MRSETKLFEDTLEEDIDEEESFDEKFKSFKSSTIKKKGISNFNAVDWWQFAIKSVLKDNRSKLG
jgi:hypothetical protein